MRWNKIFLVSAGVVCSTLAFATTTFNITPETKMVGENLSAKVGYKETFSDIAIRNDVGYYALVDANPHIDPWEPKEGTELLIPRQFILPPGPRDGITVNLAELRLYFYSADGKTVTTSPIGIGSELTPTPITDGRVTGKQKHPSWYVPDSIMEEHEERGDSLDRVVPPGPDNPLGDYKLTLSIPGYLIHGTNHSSGIGRRLTHGCMRMYPPDIEYLFSHVIIGTPVHIIHAPVKTASVDGTLYVEMHQPLAEYIPNKSQLVTELMNLIDKHGPTAEFNVDWAKVKTMAKNPSGVPIAVGGLGFHFFGSEKSDKPVTTTTTDVQVQAVPEEPSTEDASQ